MRKHSTVESVEDREVTLLAIIETIICIVIYLAIAWRYQTFLHFAIAALFAPLFLFKTKNSVEFVQSAYVESLIQFGIAHEAGDGKKLEAADGRSPWYYWVVFTVSIPLVMIHMMFFFAWVFAIRFFSFVYFLFSAPIESIKEIPSNWYRQVFCVDFYFLPEIVPGENIRGELYPENDFGLLHVFFRHFKKISQIKERWDRVEIYFIAAMWFLPCLTAYAFSLAYRIGFKATSLIYFPLVWASWWAMSDGRPIYERLSRFSVGELEKTRRAVSLVAAPIVAIYIAMLCGFIDVKEVLNKLNESVWAMFIGLWLEKFLSSEFWVWWVWAVAIEGILTFAIFYFADAAIAKKNGTKPWPESAVEVISSILITTRSIFSVLLFCSSVIYTAIFVGSS